ncbi:MAG: Gfo/Idh/MocA family oxidoreductase [Gemmatimonadota bacterium]|nr:Gfo/Idh/MocA family oxidoreductase [Gemmatimonadota bacterium]
MSSAVRIGVIGCGRILNAHLRGFRTLQENGFGDCFRITALCARRCEDALRFRTRGEGPGPRPAPVEAAGDPLNAPHAYISDLHPGRETAVYTDYREMLERGPVDAVCILTGHDTHHTIAIDAMRAGMHAIVEKPMAISVGAAQRMCEAASETNTVLSVAENVNFTPAVRASRWAVREGLIGDVQMVYRGAIGFRSHRPDLVAARTPWRQSKLGAGGGVSIDLGVHLFNGVRTICGPVHSVQALWRILEPVRVVMSDDDNKVADEVRNQVDDVFFSNFRLANGAIGHIAVARSARGTQIGVPGGTNVFGSTGALSDGKLFSEDGTVEDVLKRFRREAPDRERDAAMPAGITDPFALENLDWLRAIRDGSQVRMSGAEGTIDLALSYAILESGLLGREVSLDEMLRGDADGYQRPINAHYGL